MPKSKHRKKPDHLTTKNNVHEYCTKKYMLQLVHDFDTIKEGMFKGQRTYKFNANGKPIMRRIMHDHRSFNNPPKA